MCIRDSYCRESGVRNLKKHIEKIYRKAALKVVKELSIEDLLGQIQATTGAEEPTDVRAGRRRGALRRPNRWYITKLASHQDETARGLFPAGGWSHVINECNDIDNILLLVWNVVNVMYGCFVKGV